LQLTILSWRLSTCTNMSHVNQCPAEEAPQSEPENLVTLIAARCCWNNYVCFVKKNNSDAYGMHVYRSTHHYYDIIYYHTSKLATNHVSFCDLHAGMKIVWIFSDRIRDQICLEGFRSVRIRVRIFNIRYRIRMLIFKCILSGMVVFESESGQKYENKYDISDIRPYPIRFHPYLHAGCLH
jgi:hypothetical protein